MSTVDGSFYKTWLFRSMLLGYWQKFHAKYVDKVFSDTLQSSYVNWCWILWWYERVLYYVVFQGCLPYQHNMLRYWRSLARTGVGGWGFDAGEEALDIAFTSKEGSRRVNYSILFWWGSDEKFWWEAIVSPSGFLILKLYRYKWLKGKPGASSCGNTSFKNVYQHCCN